MKPGHLHEIGHRAFAAVILPVGIRHEADGRIECEPGFGCAHSRRIEGKRSLKPLQEIKNDEAGQTEKQQRRRIGGPMLFFALAGPGETVKASLHGNEDGRKECAIAVEDARHVAAERFHEQNDDPAEDEDL